MSAQQQARGVLMGLLDTPHRPGHFDNRHRRGCQCCEEASQAKSESSFLRRPIAHFKGRFRQKVVISSSIEDLAGSLLPDGIHSQFTVLPLSVSSSTIKSQCFGVAGSRRAAATAAALSTGTYCAYLGRPARYRRVRRRRTCLEGKNDLRNH